LSQKTKRKRTRNCGKRAKLNSQGFKTYKNFRLYIAETSNGGYSRNPKPAPRSQIVDIVRDLWNNDKSVKAMRKHIKEISIRYTQNGIAGTWFKDKQKIVVNDNGRDSIPFYKSVLIHEIVGHTFWDFSRKYRRLELIAFNKLANKLSPVSTYVKKHTDEWKKINDEYDDFEQFKKSVEHIPEWDANEKLMNEYDEKQKAFNENRKTNGHDLMTRYVNEQHSAITEIVYGSNGHDTLLDKENIEKLIVLWRRLHY